MRQHLSEAELNDLVDGFTPDAERRATTSHLKSCAACSRDLKALREITTAVRGLSREVPPPPHLWTAIASRTVEESVSMERASPSGRGAGVEGRDQGLAVERVRRVGRRASEFRTALAATVVLAVIGLGILWWMAAPTRVPRAPGGTGAPAVAATRGGRPAHPAAVLAAAEDRYRTAELELRSVLEEHGRSLPLASRQALEESLRAIDRAIASVREVHETQPSDPHLVMRILAAHQQKLALLDRAARMARLEL